MHPTGLAQSPFVLTAVDGTVTAHVRTTGAIAWAFRVPDGTTDNRVYTRLHADERHVVLVAARMNDKGLFASADGTAHVCCLAYETGLLLWQQQVKGGVNMGHFTATLLIEGGQVFLVHCDKLSAYALETGRLLWQVKVDRAFDRSQPVPVALAVAGLAEQGDATR